MRTDLALRADGLANGGAIRAGGDGAIVVSGLLDNGVGSIASGRHTTILAGSLASAAAGVLGAGIATDGSLAGPGDLSITTADRLVASGATVAAGRLALQGATLDLADGRVRGADIALTATTGDVVTVTNVGGSMSAGDTLSLVDPNRATPAARTLAVVNTNGRLAAGKALVLDAATFSGDGSLTSAGDLSVALTRDLINDATVSANGNLGYATTGSLTNNGQLLAGQTLRVTGRDILNAQGATMRGDTTAVSAAGK